MQLLGLVSCLALLLPAAAPLRICAFNIQSFGDSKLSDKGISKIIVKILSRYDIALVQEVRDADLSAVRELMERLNSASKHSYAYEISGSLGRENYKEMYLFIYRTESVTPLEKYQYPDKDNAFSRAPFIVKFSTPGSKEDELILVPLHTPPSDAVAEIDALYDVYLKIIDKWGTDVSAKDEVALCERMHRIVLLSPLREAIARELRGNIRDQNDRSPRAFWVSGRLLGEAGWW